MVSCLVAVVSLASPLWVQAAPKVHWVPASTSFKVGQPISGKVVVTFAEGMHAYQNPPSRNYMIPLQVKTSQKGWTLNPTYPKGVEGMVGGETEPALLYEGKVEIPVLLKGTPKQGMQAVTLDVVFQQCNATVCFPPETLALKAVFTVAKKPAPKKGETCPCCK